MTWLARTMQDAPQPPVVPSFITTGVVGGGTITYSGGFLPTAGTYTNYAGTFVSTPGGIGSCLGYMAHVVLINYVDNLGYNTNGNGITISGAPQIVDSTNGVVYHGPYGADAGATIVYYTPPPPTPPYIQETTGVWIYIGFAPVATFNTSRTLTITWPSIVTVGASYSATSALSDLYLGSTSRTLSSGMHVGSSAGGTFSVASGGTYGPTISPTAAGDIVVGGTADGQTAYSGSAPTANWTPAPAGLAYNKNIGSYIAQFMVDYCPTISPFNYSQIRTGNYSGQNLSSNGAYGIATITGF